MKERVKRFVADYEAILDIKKNVVSKCNSLMDYLNIFLAYIIPVTIFLVVGNLFNYTKNFNYIAYILNAAVLSSFIFNLIFKEKKFRKSNKTHYDYKIYIYYQVIKQLLFQASITLVMFYFVFGLLVHQIDYILLITLLFLLVIIVLIINTLSKYKILFVRILLEVVLYSLLFMLTVKLFPIDNLVYSLSFYVVCSYIVGEIRYLQPVVENKGVWILKIILMSLLFFFVYADSTSNLLWSTKNSRYFEYLEFYDNREKYWYLNTMFGQEYDVDDVKVIIFEGTILLERFYDSNEQISYYDTEIIGNKDLIYVEEDYYIHTYYWNDSSENLSGRIDNFYKITESEIVKISDPEFESFIDFQDEEYSFEYTEFKVLSKAILGNKLYVATTDCIVAYELIDYRYATPVYFAFDNYENTDIDFIEYDNVNYIMTKETSGLINEYQIFQLNDNLTLTLLEEFSSRLDLDLTFVVDNQFYFNYDHFLRVLNNGELNYVYDDVKFVSSDYLYTQSTQLLDNIGQYIYYEEMDSDGTVNTTYELVHYSNNHVLVEDNKVITVYTIDDFFGERVSGVIVDTYLDEVRYNFYYVNDTIILKNYESVYVYSSSGKLISYFDYDYSKESHIFTNDMIYKYKYAYPNLESTTLDESTLEQFNPTQLGSFGFKSESIERVWVFEYAMLLIILALPRVSNKLEIFDEEKKSDLI